MKPKNRIPQGVLIAAIVAALMAIGLITARSYALQVEWGDGRFDLRPASASPTPKADP